MITIRTGSKMNTPFADPSNNHLCPECGTVMSEADRITENGISFIWYECTREDCNGQWLEKEAAAMGVA
jgi:hypothetical protein